MSCEAIVKVLYLDDDTIRYGYELYSELQMTLFATQRTNRETCRGGFQTRPLSADAVRVILSGSSAHGQDYSR